ncbi:uncharacterized protein AMSG_08730 [Thecamonas trahens ATCC 50062]|uniref:C2 domain-containing protein n=1 Tax=Thecamonas trahens ATCC 50062 TaxID=461836 RepID=A0A0L0DLQ3_THETB|nr:hypothetical protein AMSG_08730 [Thecamonas trahens ATCC 50062]KNC53244.1 hypothetical protein AMSG_08730 [Thecamonas trahens ATCC 50062]|eukprot:XP_013754509.1 hypothetical protein AMSG_08730 [Thecamonas trahens ATCC 50062]
MEERLHAARQQLEALTARVRAERDAQRGESVTEHPLSRGLHMTDLGGPARLRADEPQVAPSRLAATAPLPLYAHRPTGGGSAALREVPLALSSTERTSRSTWMPLARQPPSRLATSDAVLVGSGRDMAAEQYKEMYLRMRDREAAAAQTLDAERAAHEAARIQWIASVQERDQTLSALQVRLEAAGALERVNSVLKSEHETLLSEVAALKHRIHACEGQKASLEAALEKQHRTVMELEAALARNEADARLRVNAEAQRAGKLEELLAAARAIMNEQERTLEVLRGEAEAAREAASAARVQAKTLPRDISSSPSPSPSPLSSANKAKVDEASALALATLERQCQLMGDELHDIGALASRLEAERDALKDKVDSMAADVRATRGAALDLQKENASLRNQLLHKPDPAKLQSELVSVRAALDREAARAADLERSAAKASEQTSLLSENESLAVKLIEAEAALAANSRELSAARKPPPLPTRLCEALERLAAAEADATALREDVVKLQAQLAAAEEQATTAREDASALRAQLAAGEVQLQAAANGVNVELPAAQVSEADRKQIDSLKADLAAAEAAAATAREQVEELQTELASALQAAGNNSKEQESVEAELAAKVAELEKQLDAAQDEVARAVHEAVNVQETLNEVQAEAEAERKSAASLVAALEEERDSAKSLVASLEAELFSAGKEGAEQVRDLGRRVNELEFALSVAESRSAEAEASRKRAEAHIAELEAEASALERSDDSDSDGTALTAVTHDSESSSSRDVGTAQRNDLPTKAQSSARDRYSTLRDSKQWTYETMDSVSTLSSYPMSHNVVAELNNENERLRDELAVLEDKYAHITEKAVALEDKFKAKLQEVMQMMANQVAYARELETEIEEIESHNAELQIALDEAKQALLESNLKIKSLQGNIHALGAPAAEDANGGDDGAGPAVVIKVDTPGRDKGKGDSDSPVPTLQLPKSGSPPPVSPRPRLAGQMALSTPQHAQLVSRNKKASPGNRKSPGEKSVFELFSSETAKEPCVACGKLLQPLSSLLFGEESFHAHCAPMCAACQQPLVGVTTPEQREAKAQQIQASISADRRTLTGLVSLEELYLEGSVERAAVEEQIALLEANVRAATRDMHGLFFYEPPWVRIETEDGFGRVHFECIRDANDGSPILAAFPQLELSIPAQAQVALNEVTDLTASPTLNLSSSAAGLPDGERSLSARIKVEVVNARGLHQPGRHKPNVYCQVKHGRTKRKTKVVKRSLAPVWREAFVLTLDTDVPSIEVSVMGKEKLRDSFLGRVVINIAKFCDGERHDDVFILQRRSSKNRVSGDIRLRLQAFLQPPPMSQASSSASLPIGSPSGGGSPKTAHFPLSHS